MRGDPIEAWIKRERDKYDIVEQFWIWLGLEVLLDDYRKMADTGQRLSSHE